MNTIPLFILLLLSFLLGYFIDSPIKIGSDVAIVKTIKMAFSVRNTSAIAISSENVLIFLPGITNSPQHIGVNAKSSFLVESKGINDRLAVTLNNIPPYYNNDILITASVSLSVNSSESKLVPPKLNKISDISNVAKSLSEEILNNTSRNYPEAIAEWISLNIKQEQYNSEQQSVERTLEIRRGDCTDVAELARQLLVYEDIPAFVVGGFVVKGSSAFVAAREYHNWIYYLENGLWKIMDPSTGLVDVNYSDYVAFDIFQNEKNYSRFSTTNQNLELLMK